jgi:putative transposase
MGKRGIRYKVEEIIRKLREAEVYQAQGKDLDEICRLLMIAKPTYYRWRKEYGGMELDQARRFKEIEKENSRLKQIVANQAIDISILKEVSKGNF